MSYLQASYTRVDKNTEKCLLYSYSSGDKRSDCIRLRLKYVTQIYVNTFCNSQKGMPFYKTDERESPQEAKPARENSSLGFIEAVHQ